jgi:hypothetical protein
MISIVEKVIGTCNYSTFGWKKCKFYIHYGVHAWMNEDVIDFATD